MGRNGQIAVNTIFYILMVVFMVAILVFGIQKLFFAKDVVSEQERLELQKELITAYEYCEDPLNSGNIKVFEFKTNLFNAIYLLGDDIHTNPNYNNDEFVALYEAGDNVVLTKQNSFEAGNWDDMYVVDSFAVEVTIDETFGNRDLDFDGTIEVKIVCS